MSELTRRGFLGAVGAGATVAATAGVLGQGTAGAAEAQYYMKWGSVLSPEGDFNRNMNLLRRMRPQTVRVSMYWGGRGPWFNEWHLDQVLGTGINEMIIQSSENPGVNDAYWQLDRWLGYIDAHPNILFVWEIGNEPDWHTDPWTARWLRLATIRDNKWRQDRGNLMWAINMPAGRWRNQHDPNFQWSSSAYFDAYVRDTGDGLGGLLTGPYRPDIVTAHTYSWDYLRRHPERGEHNPYKMVDYVRGWNSSISMKITEAGIDGHKPDRGYRYVDYGRRIAGETNGQIDSVIFYGLPIADAEYDIYETEADQIGTHP